MSLGKSSAIYLLALAAFAATSAKAQQWQPSPEQLASANDVLNRYFSATGKGLAQETYDLMSDRYHALDTFPAFEEDFNRTFSATGTLKDVQWTSPEKVEGFSDNLSESEEQEWVSQRQTRGA